MKNFIKMSFKSVIRDKFTKAIIIILSLIFLMGTILSIYQKGAKIYVDKYSYAPYYMRLLVVGKEEMNDVTETIEELKNIEHVSSAFNIYNLPVVSFHSDNLKKGNSNGYFEAYISDNNTIPEVTNGNNYPDNEGYYLICPETMYASSSINDENSNNKITNKDKIDVNNLINTDIILSYYAYYGNDDTTYKNITATIIGTYAVDNGYIMDNICYMNENLRRAVYIGQYEDESDDYKYEDETIVVVVDDAANMDKVTEKISDMGYFYYSLGEIDEEFLNDIIDSTNYYSAIIIVISACLILVLFSILFNRNVRNYKILQYLGYSKLSIINFTLISNIIISLLAFVLSLILSGIYMLIAQIIVYFRPFIFNKYPVTFSIDYLLKIAVVSLFFIFIISFISSISLERKIDRLDREDD